MTPLIHKWARILPYPGDGAHWFDLGTLSGQVEEFDWSDDRIARLPFQRTLIVASDQRGDEEDVPFSVLWRRAIDAAMGASNA